MNSEKDRYVVIPNTVLYHSELSTFSKLLFGEIKRLSYRSGYSYAPLSYFSKIFGVNKKTIIRAVKQLEKNNIITVERNKSHGVNDVNKMYPYNADTNFGQVGTQTSHQQGTNMSCLRGQKCHPNNTSKYIQDKNSNSYSSEDDSFREFWNKNLTRLGAYDDRHK